MGTRHCGGIERERESKSSRLVEREKECWLEMVLM